MAKYKLTKEELIYAFIKEKLKVEDEIVTHLLFASLDKLCTEVYETGIEQGYLIATELDDLMA